MQIQWYPGHMHKASKEMRAVLPSIDVIIEVLDARIPFSSQNPMLASIRGDKPCLKILNKSDLADPDISQLWQQFFEQDKAVKTLSLVANQTKAGDRILELVRQLASNKAEAGKTINTMIVGIPNVGKSTIINLLSGRQIAKTGNEPAVTKSQQRIKLDHGIALLDTPGVLWPNVENRNSGFRLAVTGAIKDTALDYDHIAFFAVDYLAKHYAERLKSRYQLETLEDDELWILENIGRLRGCLRGGGHVELNKVSKLLIDEIRSGALGELSFETPDVMVDELAKLEILREQKAAEKAAKQEARQQKRRNRKPKR